MVDHTDHFEEGGQAAGYIRVSSANQDTHLSVAAQKREIAEFAQANGLEIVGWYVDGEDDDSDDAIALPARQLLLTDAKSPDRLFDTVLLCTMSRPSRSLAEALAIMLELRESGVTVVSVTESTPAERLFEGIIQVVDDFVKERHGEVLGWASSICGSVRIPDQSGTAAVSSAGCGCHPGGPPSIRTVALLSLWAVSDRLRPFMVPVRRASPSRLLNKGVHVRNRRVKSLMPGSCWRKLCRSHGTFSPFGFADRPSWGHRA